ncbi:uracil-DNA glycosylase, family 4 [Abditibacterium utsteinense]|uniref:Type-5 uracil-DNA glycosylase n=1 Tax=Abditibacterium utsteinense TaxID=1960156 RepID=A0A2S8SX59_9BACT|nr:uracil-DNA glycosylase [Abditibacterium utsteinense]PQV65391.1 uracil-DNA glycosylase, family 4 [Abditibacterium utsteinense]
MTIFEFQEQQTLCARCPRLVAWREEAARNPPLRFRGETYWARPAPSLGTKNARLLIVGLAPAAHGANRTGRMFTGDKSGDWLFRSMFKSGFCNQPTSLTKNDGLELVDCYIAAAVHCAPPDNKPLPEELRNCRPFLLKELRLLGGLRVVLGLGKIGFDAAFDALREVGFTTLKSRPKFGHGAVFEVGETARGAKLWLLGTYHPSQQNTFTGRLTEPMLDAIFESAKLLTTDEHR